MMNTIQGEKKKKKDMPRGKHNKESYHFEVEC